MVAELVEVSSHTDTICYSVERFSQNYSGNFATTAIVVIQTPIFKGRPLYKYENVIIVNV